jgi:hypothetical protein
MKWQFVLTLAVAGAVCAPHRSPAQTGVPAPSSAGQAALTAAARDGKYLFVLFYKEDSDATQAVHQALAGALAGRVGQAASVAVRVTDPAEKAVVDQYGVSRSPMPLVLAVAPNGAVTGGFPLKLTEQDVAGAFVSPGQAACMKAVQQRKLVLLCVQPAGVGLPDGVREFKADPGYGPVTEVVPLRADDPAEAGFLRGLQVSPATTVPVTVLLAPPGRLLGSFPGAVTRQQLVDRVTAPQGCCPGGKCCPGGCCGPKQ